VGIKGKDPAVKALGQQQSVNAYVQATYGLKLRSVPREFEQRADAPEGVGEGMSTLAAKFREPLRNAKNDGPRMVEGIREGIRDDPHPAFRDLEPENMQGLFSMIAYYLRMGQISVDKETTGLLKKKLGVFFFKVKLSTVRNALTDRSEGLETLLRNDEARQVIIRELLNLTRHRTKDTTPKHTKVCILPALHGLDPRDQPVLLGAGITCQDWLEEVLTGTGDTVWDKAVNPGAEELHGGIVMENRRFAQTEGKENVKDRKGKTRPARFPPSEWPDIGVRLYDYLRRLREEA
jgi:hypothetical protein